MRESAIGTGDIGRTLVIVPTYNEKDNLRSLAARIRRAVPSTHLLVVDDASPDGTGRVADAIAANDPKVHVLHRHAKQGLGVAYVEGFRWARAHDFDVVVQMDADGSHQPEQLPRLLGALPGADLVVGSRWMSGGEVCDWAWVRRALSRGGNTYARWALDLPVHDATSGYRAFHANVLEKIALDGVQSQGYCFQVDIVVRALHQCLRVVEVPITFVERTRGTSKMDRAIVAEALWRITAWGVRHRLSGRGGRDEGKR